MVNGKARLTREDYCDGLGDCLPTCPTGAISFEEREAPAYDEAAVKAAQQGEKKMAVEDIMQIEDETKRKEAMMAHLAEGGEHPAGGCPKQPAAGAPVPLPHRRRAAGNSRRKNGKRGGPPPVRPAGAGRRGWLSCRRV